MNDLPPLPPEALAIKPGRYRHFKGGYYKVLGVGRHSETLEPIVLYKSLDYGTYWARPVAEWVKPQRPLLESGSSDRFIREGYFRTFFNRIMDWF